MDTRAVITAGEAVVVKIKQAMFADVPWSPNLTFTTAGKFTQLKAFGRKAFPDYDEIKLLHWLAAFSEQDVIDAFED